MANYDGAIFVGHGTSEVDGSYDPGATNGNKQEHIIAEKIVDNAVSKCSNKGLSIHRDEQNYKDNDLLGNSYRSKYCIEVHLNAGGGKRTEIYAPCKDSYLDIEFYIMDELSKLGLANGGVKSRDYDSEQTFMRTNGVALNYKDYYGVINRAYSQGVSLDILEVGFIDSTDISIVENNIDRIGTIVANAMLKACDRPLIGTTPIVPPQVINKPEEESKHMNYCVTYCNEVDKEFAETLGKLLNCHVLDARISTNWRNMAEILIAVGGDNPNKGVNGQCGFSGYTNVFIKGKDRKETLKKVYEYAEGK